jgi:thiol-disulfide isomerase/thioredoxin
MKTFITAAMLALSCLTLSAAVPGQAAPKLSKLLPGAKLPETAGKIVLVDFWASWCAPCKASFPVLTKLQTTYGPKGFVIIGVGVDDKPEAYQEFASKMKVGFSIAHDVDKQAAAAFQPESMPSSYLIDRKGVIRNVHTGFKGPKTEAEYVKEIDALLAE